MSWQGRHLWKYLQGRTPHSDWFLAWLCVRFLVLEFSGIRRIVVKMSAGDTFSILQQDLKGMESPSQYLPVEPGGNFRSCYLPARDGFGPDFRVFGLVLRAWNFFERLGRGALLLR